MLLGLIVKEVRTFQENLFHLDFIAGGLYPKLALSCISLELACQSAWHGIDIFEQPCRGSFFGPPPAHRLNPDVLENLFQKAGFRKWNHTDLSNPVLYRMDG